MSGSAQDRERLGVVLSQWRSALVDLTGRNKLLNFKHTSAATLEISSPAAGEFLRGLDRGLGFAALPEHDVVPSSAQGAGRQDDSPRGPGIVTQKRTNPMLQRALRNLRSKSSQLFLDYGLWTLQAGVGMLHWSEDGSVSDAPLVLLPVIVDIAANGEYRLRINEEDEPRHNPALAVKLEQLHIDWSGVTAQDPMDLQAVLAVARKVVACRPDWRISERIVVGQFASHKESMYKDLLENESRILNSELVRAVALGPRARFSPRRFDFAEIGLDRIDELSPPEATPLVLDADASQRQAVAAAVAGNSFVLDGPPGTGKSQTITNMIAGLLSAGRTVLFVSEKAAALDVVLDRLRSVGLDSYALALHSHNTSRKAVAQELGRALTEEASASSLSAQELSTVRETRQALSEYAAAMNEVRRPLDATLHDVLGAAGHLSSAALAYDLLPRAPRVGDDRGDGKDTRRDGFFPEEISRRDLDSILDSAAAIAEVWPVLTVPSFPWRNLQSTARVAWVALERADEAHDELVAALEFYGVLTTAGVVVDDAVLARLDKLVKLIGAGRSVPEWWLTQGDSAEIAERVGEFGMRLRTVIRAEGAALAAAGDDWENLPPRLTATVPAAERALRTMSPAGVDPAGHGERDAHRIVTEFSKAATLLERLVRDATAAAEILGIGPVGGPVMVRDLCAVLDLCPNEHRPPARWLLPDAFEQADHAAVRVLADRLEDFVTRRNVVRALQEYASVQAGPGWRIIPPDLDAEPSDAETALTRLVPPGLDITALTREQAGSFDVRFATMSGILHAAQQNAVVLAATLGCPTPMTCEQAEDLVALAASAATEQRALPDWFDPDVMSRIRELTREISAAATELATAREAAEPWFRPELVTVPEAAGLLESLIDGPRGLGGLLSRRIRGARKVVAGVAVEGSWRSELYDHLPLAVAWCAAHARLRALSSDNADLLGRYGGADLPDVVALEAACAHGELVHRFAAAAVVDEQRRRTLAGQLGDGRLTAPDVRLLGDELRGALATWRANVVQSPLADVAQDLLKHPLGEAGDWLAAHGEPFRLAGAFMDRLAGIRGVDAPAAGQTVGADRDVVTAAQGARRVTSEFDRCRSADESLLGRWYRGLETELPGSPDGDRLEAKGSGTADELLLRAVELVYCSPAPRAAEADAEVLGRYLTVLDTAELGRALSAAETVSLLAADVLADPARRARLVEALADGHPPRPDLGAAADGLRTELSAWESCLAGSDFTVAGPALSLLPLGAAGDWLRAHIEPFDAAAELVKAVSQVCGTDSTLTLAGARGVIEMIAAARAAQLDFDEREAEWRDLLGELYRGVDTDQDEMVAGLDWAERVRRTAHGRSPAPVSQEAAGIMLSPTADTAFGPAYSHWLTVRSELADCFDAARAAEIAGAVKHSLPQAKALLDTLAADELGPEGWQRYAEARARLRKFGLENLAAQLAGRGMAAADFPATVERTVLTAWIEHQLTTDSRVATYRAVDRNRLVERFRAGDRAVVEAAHATVIAACNGRRPRRLDGGDAGLIKREAVKKTRHMPVRMLLSDSREVVQRIKPCFMMSPLTVSQFLPPDFHFDTVIFDEASQVLPQDAANSIYRGKALIVAGDQKQLPPTSFFSATGEAEDDEWQENDSAAFESVLDLCKGSGVLRSLPLRWHYRSRHEHLVAFSNHEFYDRSMVTFPGVLETGPDIGVEFFHADGVYDRGGRRDNPREAKVVAARVMHHFSTRPDRSLGVVALSKPQADAIEDAVQRARAERPDLDHFFTEDRLNGFFVKNLESVQGDERDVIILSIGYGPDKEGKLRSTFGPINKDGGWRRLNVAVTRARRRMEVVASFHGSELPDSANRSVAHLKRYLMYAEQGPQVLPATGSSTSVDSHGPFEQDVLDALRSWGYDVEPQVGVAGYRIDMAVRHPEAPGVFALGIECDGAMYHSSRAARDRDRLRATVLRDLGWQLFRVWSIDWYRDRATAMTRLRKAAEAACAIDPHVPEPITARPAPVAGESAPAAVEYVSVASEPAAWTRPYPAMTWQTLTSLRHRVAKEQRVPDVALQAPQAAGVVAEVVMRVIEEEGPIEESVIVVRARTAWELQRAGRVFQEAVRSVLNGLVRQHRIIRTATTYDLPGRTVTAVRVPVGDYIRKVGEIPPAERQLALRCLVADMPGMQRDELLREAASLLGWSRVGADIRSALSGDLVLLLRRGEITETETGLRVGVTRGAGR
ncbi:DUF3320 domain-containing protein [Nocardia sp. NPDC088792]|uniref:DUF3320 domain-containing protein n=1 Tax=Nocardia sp. NPDC088792 TaxID=3364332 RepID=UPI0037F1C572